MIAAASFGAGSAGVSPALSGSARTEFFISVVTSFLRALADRTSAPPASRPTKSFPVAGRPRIAAHVITAFFPITGLVVFEKAHASNPLRRFPGVELRNDQAHWAAVFRRNRLAVVHESEERIFFEEIFDGNVRGPTVIVSESEYKLCFRFHPCKVGDLARRDTGPDIVEPRPARYAMKVCVDFYRRQLDEFIQ